METLARDIGDDGDLDALMTRVREIALGTGTGGSATAAEQAEGEAPGCDSDLIRVIDAQGEWNEHTRKALGELVQCLQTLRDDWVGAQQRLLQEMGQLSALVHHLRTTPDGAVARPNAPSPRARNRLAVPSRRTERVRQATKGGKQRS